VVTLLWFAIGAPSAFAQTSTWNTGNGAWSAPGNWTGGVPGSTSDVVIGLTTFNFGSPVLDVNTTVNTLNLGAQASLTFNKLSSLAVNGATTLGGQTNVNEGTLTLDGAAENFGTINLTTQTTTFNGHTVILGEGFLNGTGTLGNAGTIQGAGDVSVAISNLGTIQATDNSNPLTLSGNVTNGGVIQGNLGTIALGGGTVSGGILKGSFSSNGGTINHAQLGTITTLTSPGTSFFLTSSSTLGIQGTVTNAGGTSLGTGSTLNGGGTATLVNSSGQVIQGNGNNTIIGMNISNAGGILLGGGGGLTLNGVLVNGGVVSGQFTPLNGTTVSNAELGSTGTPGSFTLTGGSTLGVQGLVTIGQAVTLGNGVTLNGGGTATLSNPVSITGNGATLIGMNVNNVGTMTGAGAGITLNGVSVNGGILNGLFTPLNGTTIANAQLGSGTPFTLPDGSTLALRGDVTVGPGLTLGSGVTLNGGGQTTLFNTNGSFITGNGATITGMNINNTGNLIGVGAGLTLNAVSLNGGFLNGQLTTLNGTTVANAQLFDLSLTSGSILALEGTVTQIGQFTNAGTLLVNSGATLNNTSLAFGGTSISYIQTAGHTIVDGTIGIGGPAVQLQGGILSGTGAVNSGLVNVGGIVQPGDGGAPGTLFVTSYEQQSGAIFNELIGSSGNGELRSGIGSITLDPGAVLDIDLLNGFIPTDGETFDIMEAPELSGTFANGPTAGFQMDGFNWTIAYDTNDIVLDAVSEVNGGGTGGGGTTVPEPSSFLPLFAGVVVLFAGVNWRNRVRAAC
jgi:hypothetical protein